MSRRLDLVNGVVELAHGSGGRASSQLTRELFQPCLGNPEIDKSDDGAVLSVEAGRMVVATDSHVISPLFFPGGDIGSLAVHGSVNDVAVMGARPKHLTAGFIIEEGFALRDLKRIAESMGEAARGCGVDVVAADTKVVKRGEADGIYITTTCIGMVPEDVHLDAVNIKAGDKILISGSIGDHGAAIMACREELGLSGELVSDSAPLHELTQALLESGATVHFMRDPTRGGVATVLNEVAAMCGLGMEIREQALSVKEPVRAVSELLGLEPLYFACEGRVVVVCTADGAEKALAAMQSHPAGKDAAIIGEVADGLPHLVVNNGWGGKRIVNMLTGDQLPRIC